MNDKKDSICLITILSSFQKRIAFQLIDVKMVGFNNDRIRFTLAAAVPAVIAIIFLVVTHDASGSTECIAYNNRTQAITMACDATFSDIASSNLPDSVLHGNTTSGEWTLDADLYVGDGATLSINQQDVSWLKIAGAHGIVVNGRLQMDGIKVTSWDTGTGGVIPQEPLGSIERAFIQLNGSEGGWILNSEVAYLGHAEPGKRGIDLYGVLPSSAFSIVNSKIHHMFHAVHTVQSYNITIKDSEFHDNVGYSIDPHRGSHDIRIIGNHVHHNNGIGIICSVDCYDIVVEKNLVHDNGKVGIMFSRNTTNSVARFNTVYGGPVGIAITESAHNRIYNNSISVTTSAITLNTQGDAPDRVSVNNTISSNLIRDSLYGIKITQSEDNAAINNEFDRVGQEYLLSDNSALNIEDQDFSEVQLRGGAGSNAFNVTNTGEVVESEP
jgi:mannuronan 5-epimerase